MADDLHIHKLLSNVDRVTPTHGYNVVEIDDMGHNHEEHLRVCCNKATEDEANDEAQRLATDEPDKRFVVYGPHGT